MKWGEFDLALISDGLLWLDGGAMFGVVPRTLWEKHTPADERNRIPLAMNCLLVRTGTLNILIDTGCGHKFTPKEKDIFRIEHSTDILRGLAQRGLGAGDIDLLINTHLHFDHCGGNTRKAGEAIVPTFPKATCIVRKQELEAAESPDERTRASYRPENWRPLAERGLLRVVDEDTEIVPGITVVATPGHTAGHQSVKIESEGRTFFFLADLCPTTAHVPLPWVMAYDLYPMTTLETRRKIYRQAADEGWLVFFEHEPGPPIGYLKEISGKYILQPQNWEE